MKEFLDKNNSICDMNRRDTYYDSLNLMTDKQRDINGYVMKYVSLSKRKKRDQ